MIIVKSLIIMARMCHHHEKRQQWFSRVWSSWYSSPQVTSAFFCLPPKKSKVGVCSMELLIAHTGRAGRRGYKGGIKRIFSSATKMASKAADDRDKKTWKEARRRSCSPDICSEASIPYQLPALIVNATDLAFSSLLLKSPQSSEMFLKSCINKKYLQNPLILSKLAVANQ